MASAKAGALSVAHQSLYNDNNPRELQIHYQYGDRNLLEELEIAFTTETTIFSFPFLKVTKIPSMIGRLGHLQELNLCYNLITEVPKSFYELVSLRKVTKHSQNHFSFIHSVDSQ